MRAKDEQVLKGREQFECDRDSLNTQDARIGDLASKLEGKLTLRVIGNLGSGFGEKAKKCIFHVDGNALDSTGADAYDCIFNINGNVRYYTAQSAKNCTFNIEGKEHGHFGWWAENNTFNISGSIADMLGVKSENCIYRTNNPKTHKKMLEMVNLEQNKVELIK